MIGFCTFLADADLIGGAVERIHQQSGNDNSIFIIHIDTTPGVFLRRFERNRSDAGAKQYGVFPVHLNGSVKRVMARGEEHIFARFKRVIDLHFRVAFLGHVPPGKQILNFAFSHIGGRPRGADPILLPRRDKYFVFSVIVHKKKRFFPDNGRVGNGRVYRIGIRSIDAALPNHVVGTSHRAGTGGKQRVSRVPLLLASPVGAR